jgi:hypothetical protein
MTEAEFFEGYPEARPLYDAVRRAAAGLGPWTTRIGKTQIAFRREHPFAAVWVPERHLRRPAAPLVLTIFARHRIASPRWKEVVEPAPGRFTHHLEVFQREDVDTEVAGWLRQAWDEAG